MIGIEGWEITRIEESDRQAILGCLGLESFEFVYEERTGSQTLRSWLVQGASHEAGFPGSKTPEGLPVLVRSHLHNLLAEVPLFEGGGLWDDLLPFPFRIWGAHPVVEAAGLVEASDRVCLETATLLRQVFTGLLDRLTQAELSLLTLSRSDGETITLYFHSVRRRFLAMGRVRKEPVDGVADLARRAASFQHLHWEIPAPATSFADQVQAVKAAFEQIEGSPAPSYGLEPQASAVPPIAYPADS